MTSPPSAAGCRWCGCRSTRRNAGFAVNVFIRDGGVVYRTWHTDGRGTEQLGYLHGLIDVLPWGRQEEWDDSLEGWPRHGTYDGAAPSSVFGELYGAGRN